MPMSELIAEAIKNLEIYVSMSLSGALHLQLISEKTQAKDMDLRGGQGDSLADELLKMPITQFNLLDIILQEVIELAFESISLQFQGMVSF